MIKAVLFDLDETLYDEFGFVKGGFMDVSKYVKNEFGLNDKGVYTSLIDSFKKDGRGKNFNVVFKGYKFFNIRVLKKMIKIYRDHHPAIKPYKETIPVLTELKEKYLLGIITDEKKVMQKRKIKSLGIKKFFDIIVFTDDLKAEKPKKDAFVFALKKLALCGEEVIYIGDNPLKDFSGAKYLKIKTIRLMKGYFKDLRVSKKLDADIKIKSLEELPDKIAKIDNQW